MELWIPKISACTGEDLIQTVMEIHDGNEQKKCI